MYLSKKKIPEYTLQKTTQAHHNVVFFLISEIEKKGQP